jgi:hypothetical protein
MINFPEMYLIEVISIPYLTNLQEELQNFIFLVENFRFVLMMRISVNMKFYLETAELSEKRTLSWTTERDSKTKPCLQDYCRASIKVFNCRSREEIT